MIKLNILTHEESMRILRGVAKTQVYGDALAAFARSHTDALIRIQLLEEEIKARDTRITELKARVAELSGKAVDMADALEARADVRDQEGGEA